MADDAAGIEWWRVGARTGDVAQAMQALNAGPSETALPRSFGRPAEQLAVYGTLAPGEVNHGVVATIEGTWDDGFVRGTLSRVGWGVDYGFPALTWHPRGPRVPVKLLTAKDLPRHWDRIDRFEGDAYRRILVPVEDDSGTVFAVANVYVARS